MPRRKHGTRNPSDPSKGRTRRVTLIDQSALNAQIEVFNGKRMRANGDQFRGKSKFRPAGHAAGRHAHVARR
jgi:hypothetical protein